MAIKLFSEKSGWKGRIDWSFDGSYVTATLYTWKTDGLPSSSPSGAHFQARITIGSQEETFSFQQQEPDEMYVGSTSAYVSGTSVYIGGQVDAPYGVSMFGFPLSGGETVTLAQEPEWVEPSTMTLSPNPVTMGQTLNISISRNSPKCTHILKYRVADSSAAMVEIESAALTSYAWKVPDLMQWCENKGSVQVELYCITAIADAWMGQDMQVITVTVPPATKPSCPTTAAMGSSLPITLERRSPGYTHDLRFVLADTAGDIAAGAAAAHSWDIPLDLAKAIPLLTKGTCTISCITRNGSYEVGRETVTVQLTVPDNEYTKPTGTMTLSPAGDLGEAFSGLYVRGRTGVRAEFTGESVYSQVDRFELTVEGNTVTGNPAQSPYLNTHGTVTVTGRIVDARGYAREISREIAVIPYDIPRVIPYPGESSLVAVRCRADGTRDPRGEHLLLKAGRRYTHLKDEGGQRNFCRLSYRLKAASAGYSDWYTLLEGENLETDAVSCVAENAVPEVKAAYTLQFRAEDTLGGFSTVTVPVAALTLPLHIGKGNRNLAVGKYCDYSRENAFEVGFTTYFDTGISLRPIFAGSAWEMGEELGISVPTADTAALEHYSFFLAISGETPHWLMKYAGTLFGPGIRITLDGPITLAEAEKPITALYAVL